MPSNPYTLECGGSILFMTSPRLQYAKMEHCNQASIDNSLVNNAGHEKKKQYSPHHRESHVPDILTVVRPACKTLANRIQHEQK